MSRAFTTVPRGKLPEAFGISKRQLASAMEAMRLLLWKPAFQDA